MRDRLVVRRLRFYLGYAMNPDGTPALVSGHPGYRGNKRSAHRFTPDFYSVSFRQRQVLTRFHFQPALLATADNALSNIEEINNFKSRMGCRRRTCIAGKLKRYKFSGENFNRNIYNIFSCMRERERKGEKKPFFLSYHIIKQIS